MGGCTLCSRWFITFISFSTIIWTIVAIVLFCIRFKDKNWYKIIGINVDIVVIVAAFALGLITAIIGVIFYCGRSKCLYLLYFIFLLLALIAEAISIILIYKHKDEILNSIDKNWNKDKYRNSRINVEKHYRCCGFKTPEPPSQCGYKPEQEYHDLCYDQINYEINKYRKDLKITIIVTAVVEFLLLLCACYLLCSKSDK